LLFPNIKCYYLPDKYCLHENTNVVLQQYRFSLDHVSLDKLGYFVNLKKKPTLFIVLEMRFYGIIWIMVMCRHLE